jgi:hypothetical protein
MRYHDVIVVGGGLAGLRAAVALNQYNTPYAPTPSPPRVVSTPPLATILGAATTVWSVTLSTP